MGKQWKHFILRGSKITAGGDCSHEIKRRLLFGRKAKLKSRDFTLPTNVRLGFSSGHVWMWELDYRESWALKNWCFRTVVLEKTPWESLGLQGDPTSPSKIHWKDWCWSWNSSILATWCEELTPWEIPWCWERLRAGGEGDDRGWDGWMASLTWWTWVWESSGSWWWTEKPGWGNPWGCKESNSTERLNWSDYFQGVTVLSLWY